MRYLYSIRLLCLLLVPSLLVAFSPNESSAAGKAVVSDVKHWSNPNYTRVVIELSKKAVFSQRLLKQDPSIKMEWRRLYIDIKGAKLAGALKKPIPINDGLLKVARAGQYDNDTVRVVLDIESIEDYKVFPLSEPFRIVVDVTGKGVAPAPPPPPSIAPPVASEDAAQKIPRLEGPKKTEIRKAKEGITITQQLGLKVRKIVIDPGHGGKDPGAIGRGGLKEKDVTLRLSKMLRERLANDSGPKIIMTRDTDVFIPLEERTAIANKYDADLFISIHINASPKKTASGIETYILNISNDEEAKRVAARENATSTRSVSDLEFILNDLIRTAKTNDSVRLATAVQERLVKGLKEKYGDTRSNGVKGAPFYVLVGTKMPSILVEVSYISNPNEEKKLQDEKYLREVIEGISTGLMRYINGPGPV
ncbi:MAG: N-acetylmuramoyl-L-alanine amidase [Deltaproteobacteria bacterium]|nr:N-acetylmuramoyl-L-alanine amidase [Deltaproteobacteria bacterium]